MAPKPLDPVEGPTVWVEDTEHPHTARILVGTDPEDPVNTVVMSVKEINRLAEYVNRR